MTIFFYPLKVDAKKVVFYASFAEDLIPIIEEMGREKKRKIILIYHPRIERDICNLKVFYKFPHANKNVLRELYHLMTSKFIIVDTYYLILGGLKKKKEQMIVQTWHASGALKKFGLEDKALENMKSSEINQYKKVYNAFDYVLVASEKMGEIFKRSFGMEDHQLLKFGLPRMDNYFKETLIAARREEIRKNLGLNTKDTMVLYLPTYRDNEQIMNRLPIDFSKLKEGFHAFVKLHPVIQTTFDSTHLLTTQATDDLLVASDIVITDYSSLAIEASLLGKPIYFYTYDQAKYDADKGLIDDYEEAINFQNYTTNEALINAINQQKSMSSGKMNEIWNTYNDGKATMRFVEWIETVDSSN